MTRPPTTRLSRTRLRDALCSAVATLLSNIWKVVSGELSGGKASACSLLVAALFAFGPPSASAQQPGPGKEIEEQAPQEHVLREQLKGLPATEREALLRRRRGQAGQALPLERTAASSAGARPKQTDANLVTRAGAGLTGVRNSSTSTADVDGDGNLDLLITGSGANDEPTTTLYLGDGAGSFTKASAGLAGVEDGATSIADVDGDGNQDLLITGRNANDDPTATLYLGDGQGGFSTAGAGLTGVEYSSTSIADVDGDSNQDLLITGRDANLDRTATLYLGDGSGGFSEAGAGLTGVSQSSISTADVDGDGNLDLLITGTDASFDPTATLYLGDGSGGFSEPGAGLTGVRNSSTSIADVDGDGNQDLLITGDDANDDPTATLYLGDGQGGFSEDDAGLAGVVQSSASIADVDGDGNQDLLITGDGANFDPTATLYLGDGQGGFSAAGAGLTGVEDGSTSIADVGADGDLDLLITGFGALFIRPSARLYVNRQNQTPPNRAPTFASEFGNDYSLAPGVTLRRSAEAGDLDGDPLSIGLKSGPSNASVNDRGNATLSTNFTPTRSQGGEVVDVSIEATDPSGLSDSFSLSVEIPPFMAAFSAGLTGVSGSSTSISDVDGDGNPDLLITGRDENLDPTTTLYLGDGTGGFSAAGAGLTGVELGSTSIADVNGDGNKDLLITGRVANDNPAATLYLGDGTGGFSVADAGLASVELSSTSIADVDGDENPDLLITGEDANDDPTAILYLGDGSGGFSEAGAGLTGVWFSSTSIADVDGDGNQDLLITGYDANFAPTATLYLGDGTGGFSTAGAGLTGITFGSTSIADVDGDGNLDVLITGEDANKDPTATLYLGDGTGGFSTAGAGLGNVESSSTSIADVDGDEDPDLLVTGFSGASRVQSSLLYENLFSNPLPVELVALEAEADGEAVRLSWQTASETGNAGFRVQRKRVQRKRVQRKGEEGAWATVGRVEGGGTTTEARSYQFTDADLPYAADALTYRLKQVDTDGSVSYSDPVTVERGVAELEFIGTYPNPARREATVRYALPERQEVRVRLYDVLGRKVRTVAYGEQKGRQERTFDVGGLSSGVYFLRLRAEGKVRTERMTVVR